MVDYGYWITALTDRTTLVDNATLSTDQIQKMAQIFMSSPDRGWNLLQEMNVDYVVVFFAATDIGSNSHENPLYVQGGGGDESKILPFIKIAGFPPERFLNVDGQTPKPNFYQNTLLGQLTPFTPVVYYNPETNENSNYYKDGFIEISVKNMKYVSDNNPLKLVYSSQSYENDSYEDQFFVLVYEVNKNYSSSYFSID